MSKNLLNIGHRGAGELALENTLGSIQQALSHGVDAVEIDVRSSKDGIPILMHDPTLNRTTSHKGFIRSYNFDDLKNLSIDEHEKIPSLSEALDLIDDKAEVVLDIKDRFSLDEIIKETKKRKNQSIYLFSDDPKLLLYLKKNLPNQRYGSLFHALWPAHPKYQIASSLLFKTPKTAINYLRFYNEIKPDFLNIGSFMLNTPLFNQWVKNKKTKLFVWGKTNKEENLKKIIDKGADAIVTDRPDILKDLKYNVK